MLALLGVIGAFAGSTATIAKTAEPPSCKAQLWIGLDGEDGAFNGMSHSGVLLVVRNLGPNSCRTPGLPVLEMQDASGRPLAFARRAPLGMHPGPVVIPVSIAPGAQATSALHWVSGPVYPRNACATPARIAVTTGPYTATLPWPGGQVCGPAGKPIPYDEPVLTTHPAKIGTSARPHT